MSNTSPESLEFHRQDPGPLRTVDGMGASRSRDICLSLLVAGFLVAMLGWFGCAALRQRGILPGWDPTEFTILMNRGPTHFMGPTFRRFTSGFTQDNLEQAARDNFPSRQSWIPAYASIRWFVDRHALSLLPASWAPLVPVGEKIVALRGEAPPGPRGVPRKQSRASGRASCLLQPTGGEAS